MPIVVLAPTPPATTSPRPAEIGQVYDLMLATRDGSALPCRNKDGQTVLISKLAFMTTIDRNQVQHEETELQHKDQLIQLSSPNVTDREFDQWPQVTQGDWSGGSLQRVLSGGSPIVSFGPLSDATRYWSGINGLIWPLSDYLPQRGYQSSTLTTPSGVLTRWANPSLPGTGNVGCVGTFMGSEAVSVFPGEGFAVANAITGAAPWVLSFWASTQNWSVTAGGAPSTGNILDMAADPRGGFWILNSPDGATTLSLLSIMATSSTALSFATVDTIFTNMTSFDITIARMASALIGNAMYFAVSYTYLPNVGGLWVTNIKLYNFTGAGGGSIVLSFPGLGSVSTTGPGNVISSMAFLGDQLIICLVDNGMFGPNVPTPGTSTRIVSYSIPSATFSTLAHLPGVPNAVIGVVSGSIVIVSQSLDVFLLQGTSLQYVATLPPPVGSVSNPFQWSVSRIAAFGPYGICAVAYQTATTTNMDVYAYDTDRGRLFKVETLSYPGLNQLPQPGFQLGVFSFWSKSASPGFTSTFNIAVPVDDISGQTAVVQILHFGVMAKSVSLPAPFQQGTDIISSLIDFTSAAVKLYRQIVMDFTALAPDALATIRLRIWLDQDPANLNVVADIDSGIISGASQPGIKTLSLPINRVAKKIVYEVTTGGGSPNVAGTWIPAPKLQAVAIQAATGWTRTMMLDLADNVMVNTKNGNCWEKQSIPGNPAIDGTVAYNFLRQLWRLKGGQVQMTFPNGDMPANWLLQDLHFDSPKPFGVSFRADQKSSLGYIATVKCREDI